MAPPRSLTALGAPYLFGACMLGACTRGVDPPPVAAPTPAATSTTGGPGDPCDPAASPSVDPSEPAASPGERTASGTVPGGDGVPPPAANPWALTLPTRPLPPVPAPAPGRFATWRLKKVIPVGQSHLQVARLGPADRHVLVISQLEHALRIYELATGRLVHRYEPAGYELLDQLEAVFWPEPSPGLRLVVAGKDGLTLRDAATGEVLEQYSREPGGAVGWSPDEQVLVVVRSQIPAQRSTIEFLTRGAGTSLRSVARIDSPHRIDDWALSADNRLLATIAYPTGSVELRELDTGTLRWSLPAPAYAGGVALSADGSRVAAGGEHLLLIDAARPEHRAEYRGFQNNIDSVVFSPASEVVIASAYDGRIRILRNDLTGPMLPLVRELRHAGAANVYELVLLRDGSGMVSVSGDMTARWWGP